MSIGKEKFKESISALMDNEASEFEFRHFLKECEGNQDLKSKWDYLINLKLGLEKVLLILQMDLKVFFQKKN